MLPTALESGLQMWFLSLPGGPSALLITHRLIPATVYALGSSLELGTSHVLGVFSAPPLSPWYWLQPSGGGFLVDPSMVAACAEGQWWPREGRLGVPLAPPSVLPCSASAGYFSFHHPCL